MPHGGKLEWVKSWVLVFGSRLYFVTIGLIVYKLWWAIWIIFVAILIMAALNEKKPPSNEKQTEDDFILIRRKEKLLEKIKITDAYLKDHFKLEQQIEEKKTQLDQYINRYNSFTSSERRYNLNNPSIFFTTPQMLELKKQLQLSKDDYVPSNSSNKANEDSTIEYLIVNTNVYEKLNRKLDYLNFRMTITTFVPIWTFYFFYQAL